MGGQDTGIGGVGSAASGGEGSAEGGGVGLEFRGFLEPHHVNGHETGWKHGADTFGAK